MIETGQNLAKPTVVIYRPVDESGTSHQQLVEAGCNVLLEPLDVPDAEISSEAAAAVALMGATFRGRLADRAFIRRFSSLRLISKYTIGIDDIDLKAATESCVLVTHAPTEANFGGVAEGTMAMMLAYLKKVRQRDRQVRSGGWRDPALQGVYLGAREDGYPGITVGIVGFGRVGSRFAELLSPWRVRILACDPYVEDSKFRRLGVERRELGELLAASDVVTLHCDLNEQTRNLINSASLESMKADALLINTARGAIVDSSALSRALRHNTLGGAALDVFDVEPLPSDDDLRDLGDKVMLAPHMVAANAGGTLGAAIPWATAATLAALRGECPENVVNTDVIRSWLERYGGNRLI